MSLGEQQAEAVRAHLEEIVNSPLFSASGRRAQLLRYLVSCPLDGKEDQISEYAIGVNVLGRPDTFDPRSESIVRTEMTRLRQKLKEYYSHAGANSLIVIELPLRTYVPRFVFRQSESEPRGPVTQAPAVTTPEVNETVRLDTHNLATRTGGLSMRAALLIAAAVILLGAPLAIWQIRRSLRVAGSRAVPESTSNSQAHDLYLEAASEGARATPEAYRKAIALFQNALQKDPSYAAAYLSVAKDEQGLILLMAQSPKQGTEEMETELRKALAVDPGLGEARGLLAELRAIRDWDWEMAEREYQVALHDGAPAFVHMMYGWALATRGRFAEAHAQLRLAQDMEPLSLDARFFEALVFYIEHRFDDSRKLLSEILKLNADYLPGHGLWAMLAILDHNCADAVPHIQWFTRNTAMPETKVLLAWESACHGERQQAESYLQQAESTSSGYASPYNIAAGYALLHESNIALDYLEKSAADHEPQILYLKYAPEFTEIRTRPRYLTLERKVGLDP